MSGSSNQLDLFIQDFLTTNRILNAHVPWLTLVSRRFVEAGAQRKVFSFQSAGATHFAVGTLLELPDGDCFRIELVAAIAAEEHRLDCLRMTCAATHTAHEVSRLPATIIIRLATRNRGLIPIVFVVREDRTLAEPVLV
ncbi:hypothetical protein EBZ80_09110 [bacterium]|nr:hypothetical protein [bacterium]